MKIPSFASSYQTGVVRDSGSRLAVCEPVSTKPLTLIREGADVASTKARARRTARFRARITLTFLKRALSVMREEIGNGVFSGPADRVRRFPGEKTGCDTERSGCHPDVATSQSHVSSEGSDRIRKTSHEVGTR